MNRLSSFALSLILMLAALAPANAQDISFGPAFSDHMVVQRNKPVAISGKSAPGEQIIVRLGKKTERTNANENGEWRVSFSAMREGGPFELKATTGGGASATLSDILIGDVFLCAGQSNMEFPVSRTPNSNLELAAAEDSRLRLLKIAHASALKPADTFINSPEWETASSATVSNFSALCYFFATDLRKTHAGVPLGLIDASWGGSQIEAWVSKASLRTLAHLQGILSTLDLYSTASREAGLRYADFWIEWWRGASPVSTLPWEEPATAYEWRRTPTELSNYQEWGVPDLENHVGMIWYRSSFTLSEEQAAQDGRLSLGAMDEVDISWVNGVFVGEKFGWGEPRFYTAPASALQPGENYLYVNVYNSYGAGGMTGPNDEMSVSFPDGSSVSLADNWRYSKVPASVGEPPMAPWQSVSGLTGLYNGMIAPLGHTKLAGVLWYQGESNVEAPERYGDVLSTLTADWRGQFGEDLPFIIVQLPGYGAAPAAPTESGWAVIRDQQRRAAAHDPLSEMVVAIDLGEADDLHPPGKRSLARRASSLARRAIYGEPVNSPAPEPMRAQRQQDVVTVEFSNLSGRSKIIGSPHPIAFELCGDDQNSCRYAEAALLEDRVTLSIPNDMTPTRVRYCWGDAPLCNWHDANGAPVTPFELNIE